jgi:hypothetical protein
MYCTACPQKVVTQTKENKRTQKLRKIWKIQKQLKKEEKKLIKEFWERGTDDGPIEFDDIFDTF